MNRRRFLATLGSLALGACLGVQRVVPLAGRVEAEPERYGSEIVRLMAEAIDRLNAAAPYACVVPTAYGSLEFRQWAVEQGYRAEPTPSG